MPDARRAAMGDFTGGFWIRRGVYPSAMPGSGRRRIQNLVAAIDSEDNIHPSLAATARRPPRDREIPLPSWYPRTPLSDITIIVNAMERRGRERAERDGQRNANPEASPVTTPEAALERRRRERVERDRQRNANTEASPVTTPAAALERRMDERAATARQTNANPAARHVTTTHAARRRRRNANHASEHNTPVGEALPTDVSDASPSPAALSTLSSLAPSSSETLSTTERVPADPSTEDPKTTKYEKKLESTISEMERFVLDNLKRSPKTPATTATRTLMLMR